MESIMNEIIEKYIFDLDDAFYEYEGKDIVNQYIINHILAFRRLKNN